MAHGVQQLQVDEAVKRKPLTRLQRVKLFDEHKGKCCLCGLSIWAERGDKWIAEHIKPLWLGGADDATNIAPAHERCAIAKTVKEAPVKAKSDRVRARHLGIKKSTRPIPGSKASGIRKRMNGNVERW